MSKDQNMTEKVNREPDSRISKGPSAQPDATVLPSPVTPAVLPKIPAAVEVVSQFQSKKAAFEGISLSGGAKEGLDQLGAVLGIKRPTVEELAKGNAGLAAEMRTVKDYEYLVLGNRIMDRATALTAEVAAQQRNGGAPEAGSDKAAQLVRFHERLQSDSRLDEFFTANIRINSRLNTGR